MNVSFFCGSANFSFKALYLTGGMTVPCPGHNSEQIVSILLTIFLMLAACLLPFLFTGYDSEQIVSILLSNFLKGCRLLAYVHHHFSAVVLVNEEIHLAGVFLFQVAEGAGMVNRK